MFEVGFTEIILIMGLALLVLGPEKLPKLAAQIGRWTGRARSMARQLRAQLDQEVSFQEQRAAHGRGESTTQARKASDDMSTAVAAAETGQATGGPDSTAAPSADGTETVAATAPASKPSNE